VQDVGRTLLSVAFEFGGEVVANLSGEEQHQNQHQDQNQDQRRRI